MNHEQPRGSRARRPPLLSEGARVALVAPAGPLRGEADLARAIDNVRSFGWEAGGRRSTRSRATAISRDRDQQRVADLNDALRDDAIDAVWCLRGGYGAMRILDSIDYEAAARRPKPIIGYSDITALHAALRDTKRDVVTYHGPTARASLSAVLARSLACALVHGGDSCGVAPDARVLRPAERARRAGRRKPRASERAHGHAVRAAAGEYDPRARGHRRGGVPSRPHAAAAAARRNCSTACARSCSGRARTVRRRRTTAPAVSTTSSRRSRRLLGVPAIVGAPVGHIDDQWTLPLGALGVARHGPSHAAWCTRP